MLITRDWNPNCSTTFHRSWSAQLRDGYLPICDLYECCGLCHVQSGLKVTSLSCGKSACVTLTFHHDCTRHSLKTHSLTWIQYHRNSIRKETEILKKVQIFGEFIKTRESLSSALRQKRIILFLATAFVMDSSWSGLQSPSINRTSIKTAVKAENPIESPWFNSSGDVHWLRSQPKLKTYCVFLREKVSCM